MSSVFRTLIYLSLIIAIARAANCDANCKDVTDNTGVCANGVCGECKSGDYWRKADGSVCISGANCGVAGDANYASFFQATDDSGKKQCVATTAICNGYTTKQYSIASAALVPATANTAAIPAVLGRCVTESGCTSAGRYVDTTAANPNCVATCPVSATVFAKDDTVKKCVDLATCSTVGSDNVVWYAKDAITAANAVTVGTTTCTAAVTGVVAQCITAAACTSIVGYYKETVANANKCKTCPSTCNSVAGSCKETTTGGATSSCWICNTVVPPCNAGGTALTTAGTQATNILKDDGTCINSDTCLGTSLATGLTTQTGNVYFSDNSNGLQPRCTSCPSSCNANTVANSVTTGTCAYGVNSNGYTTTATCTVCDTDMPVLKDGDTTTLPKSCVGSATTSDCPVTYTGTVLDYTLYSADATNKKCTVVTSSSPSSASISATTFNSTPNLVVSPGTNSTDNTNWNVPAAYVKFGAGLTNATVYAYGIKIATAGGTSSITGVVTRTINATIVSNGTDSSEASVISGGSVVSVSWPSLSVTTAGAVPGITSFYSTSVPKSILSTYYILTEAVAGYYIIAYSGYEAQWTNNLYAYAWGTAGSSTSGKVQLTSFANPAGGVSNYLYQATNIWLEDSTVYVAFVQKKAVYASTGGGAAALLGAGSPTVTDVGAYVAAFSPATGTPFYNDTAGKSSAVKVYVADGNLRAIELKCGPSNYTNSTSINCLYNAGTDTSSGSPKYNTYYVSIARSTGSVGSAASVAASSVSGATYPMTYVSFHPAGIVTGAYASGGLFYSQNWTITTATTSSCAYSYSYGLHWWNTTSGSGVWSSPGLSASGASGAYGGVSASGGTLGAGYYFTTATDTTSVTYSASCSSTGATSGTTYQFASFYANGTTNGSTITLGSVESGVANYFIDKNGTLWFGYATLEKSRASTGSPSVAQGNLYAGYVGKFQGQLFIATFGNVLSTFFAFLSLILFGLFAF